MKCNRISPQLSGYLEGDLVGSRRERVAEHLASCAACARELAELRRTVGFLRSLAEPEPSPSLTAAVIRRLRAGEGRPRAWDRWWARLPDLGAPRLAVPIGALAALVLYVSVSGEFSGPPPSGTAASDTPAAAALAAAPSAPSASTPQAPARRRPARAALPRLRTLATATREAAPDQLAAAVPTPTPAFPPAPASITVPAQSAGAVSGGVVVPGAPPLRTGSPGMDRNLLRSPAKVGLDKAERGRRELDHRLELLLRNPEAFAVLLGSDSVAAQELWMVELADRAVVREIDADAVLTLRGSKNPAARALADTLAVAVREARERIARGLPAGSAR